MVMAAALRIGAWRAVKRFVRRRDFPRTDRKSSWGAEIWAGPGHGTGREDDDDDGSPDQTWPASRDSRRGSAASSQKDELGMVQMSSRSTRCSNEHMAWMRSSLRRCQDASTQR